MKIYLFLAFLLTVAFAADATKFVSPSKLSTLVVDKSGRRDIIELQSGKRVHRLFYFGLEERSSRRAEQFKPLAMVPKGSGRLY
jgi:hypothetical protein